MTKEITKAIILQEMSDKLKLREFESSRFLFDEVVVPTYDIEQHLRKGIIDMSEKPITAIGGKSFFQVPIDEKWYLRSYNVVFMTGVFTVAGVYILRTPNTVDFMYLDLTAAQNVSYINILPCPVILGPREFIRINIDGFTSTGDLRLYIDYEKETIR